MLADLRSGEACHRGQEEVLETKNDSYVEEISSWYYSDEGAIFLHAFFHTFTRGHERENLAQTPFVLYVNRH
jgi:hypothetical protein